MTTTPDDRERALRLSQELAEQWRRDEGRHQGDVRALAARIELLLLSFLSLENGSLKAQLAERTRERDQVKTRAEEVTSRSWELFERAEKAEARARQDSEACDRMQRSLAKAEDEADRNLKAYELIQGDIQVWIRRYDEQKAEVQRLTAARRRK